MTAKGARRFPPLTRVRASAAMSLLLRRPPSSSVGTCRRKPYRVYYPVRTAGLHGECGYM